MSKKYKLKKWYPSLPKEMPVGFEVIEDNLCNYLNPQNRFYPLSPDEVENNPEFWELIKTIFVTEDKVFIDSDRKLFGVSLNDNLGYKAYDLAEHDYRYGSSINLIGFKWFIDKGKAIAYINLNRPRYSMKNLLDAKVLSSDAAGYPALFIDLNKLK